MAIGILSRSDRAHPLFFWLGAVSVTAGVVLHLPMYLRSASMNFHLAGMPFDAEMFFGMALIVAGTAAGFYGLLPTAGKRTACQNLGTVTKLQHDVPTDIGQLKWAHWQLLLVLTVAVAIDFMKPASLGFVLPGTAAEYGLSREVVGVVPILCAVRSCDRLLCMGRHRRPGGRRAAILLSGIMFVGTAHSRFNAAI